MNQTNKTHLTAISRKTLPAPTRWLIKKEFIDLHSKLDILDFGCGKCQTVNPSHWDNYDPYYCPWAGWHKLCYDVIVCNYVLCVLPEAERVPVIKEIQKKLKNGGIAYLALRNDRPKQGWGTTKRGTYQGRAQTLNLPLLFYSSQFRIYLLTKAMEFVY